jgi:outer membrane immunogenic protein
MRFDPFLNSVVRVCVAEMTRPTRLTPAIVVAAGRSIESLMGGIMKKAVLATAALVSLAAIGSAGAADLEPVLKAPAPVYDWTGFYAGIALGDRLSDVDWTTTCLEPGLAPCGTAFPNRLAYQALTPLNANGMQYGGYAGYNVQFQNVVVGAEVSANWSDSSAFSFGIPGAEDPTVAGSPGLDNATVRETWDASVRGRLGYVVTGTVLLYGTAGVSWMNVQASATCGTAFPVGWCAANSPFLGTTQTVTTTRMGWTAGGGIEVMVTPHWLARAEYRFTDYGSFGATLFTGFNGNVVNGDAFSFDTKLTTQTTLIGVAYKFGGPVVAKY